MAPQVSAKQSLRPARGGGRRAEAAGYLAETMCKLASIEEVTACEPSAAKVEPRLVVRNTFIHLRSEKREEEEELEAPVLRCFTVPAPRSASAGSLLAEEPETDDEPWYLAREGGHLVLETPRSSLGAGEAGGDVAMSPETEDGLPEMCSSRTYDPFEAAGQPWMRPCKTTDSAEAAHPPMCHSRTYDPFELDMPSTSWPAPPLPALLGAAAWPAFAVGGVLPPGFPAQLVAPVAASEKLDPAPAQRRRLPAQRRPQPREAESCARASHPQALPEASCTDLPGGAVRLRWTVDAQRFRGRDAAAVSPDFAVRAPGVGPLTLRLVVRAAGAPGCGFQAARGRGIVEVVSQSEERAHLVPRAAKHDTFVVIVDRAEGSRLGVQLEADAADGTCRVKALQGGLVAQWNGEHSKETVSPGDALLEVNGVSGDLAVMQGACAQSGLMRLVFRRAKPASDLGFDVRFGIGAGAVPVQPLRGPVRHSFGTEACCRLRAPDAVWDLLSAADRQTGKVSVFCELART